jgi:hypothetical protein
METLQTKKEDNFPVKKAMAVPEPKFEKKETIEILENCKRRILYYVEDATERLYQIGEQLIKAKETIAKDGRGTGFREWVEFNFPFSISTAERMMRAVRKNIRDSKLIWYNKRVGKEKGNVGVNADDWITFKLEVRTRNKGVIKFLKKLEEMEVTEVIKFEKNPEELPVKRCPSCNKKLTERNRTGYCAKCWPKEKRKRAVNE